MRSSLPSTALLAAVAALSVAPAIATAAPAVNGEFELPGAPGQIALGPDGNVWAVVSDGDADIAKIAPDGAVTPYRDARLANAVGITSGPDGNLWITRNGEVVRFAPADPVGTDTAVTIATLNDPKRIASDGRVLWTASADQLYRIDPASNSVTRTRIDGMSARGTAIGGDRRILIADFDGARIVSLDPTALDRPAFTDVGGRPQEVAAGSGATFAYTNAIANPQEVGVVTLPGAALRVPVPGTDPSGLAFGEDGAWWIGNFLSHDLTRLAADGTVTKLGGLSPLSGPRNVARGTGGTLWVSLEVARRVARVTGVEAPRSDPPRVDPPRSDPPPRTEPRGPLARAPKLRLERVGRPRAGARALVLKATVDMAARLDVTLTRKVAVTRGGRRCVRSQKVQRPRRGCRSTITLGSAGVTTRRAGSVRIVVRRRDRRALVAGTYRLVTRATANGRTTTRALAITLRGRR